MTQKYIPVEWTDETPTQPGTLINKARLDQMQSAHHFADGFEEVDAIPTEDPGTDYHKVVYCTADTTFYRWDGAQWTADIDDDTKRLLLEHEADHANPHQVTKAQVGLGNADNTSDADKPISTATAAALATKAEDSTVVHLAGAETIDGKKTFTKNPTISGAPPALTLVNTLDTWVSPPSADAYASIGFSDKDNVAVGNVGTVHKAGTGERRTYLRARTSGGSVNAELDVVISSDGSTKYATAPARAYDTANEDDLVTIGTLKASTDVVHRTGAETISGNKTFMADTNNNFLLKGETALGAELKIGSAATGSDPLGQIQFVKLPTLAPVAEIESDAAGLLTLSGSTAVTIQGQRAYNAANTSDVATIGTLDAYTPMVRTTGAQTIAGVKTFTADIHIKKANPEYSYMVLEDNIPRTTLPSALRRFGIRAADSNGADIGQLAIWNRTDGSKYLVFETFPLVNGTPTYKRADIIKYEADGTGYMTAPARTYNTSNTADVVTIGTLKASTDVVHTSGAETVAGTKTLTDSPVIKNPNIASSATVPGSNTQTRIIFNANDGSRLMTLEDWCYTGGSSAVNLSNGATRNSLTPNPSISLEVTATGTGNIKALNQRAYNAVNTADVATIGTLDQYTPMVRTTGNQTISGVKTFESKNTIIIGQPHGAPEEGQLIIKDYRTDAAHTIGDPTQISFNFGRLIFLDGNSNYGASIVFTNNAGVSTCELWLRNADGTRKTVILGSGDA